MTATLGAQANVPFHSVDNRFEQTECVICGKLFETSTKVTKLICGHIFCSPCGNKIIRLKQPCSYCRAPIQIDQNEKAKIVAESRRYLAMSPEERNRYLSAPENQVFLDQASGFVRGHGYMNGMDWDQLDEQIAAFEALRAHGQENGKNISRLCRNFAIIGLLTAGAAGAVFFSKQV
jgi:hypothetical protein